MPRCPQDQSSTCHHATTCQHMLVCQTTDTMCVRQEMACVSDGMIQAADKDAGSRQKRRDASMLLSRWRHKTREERGAQGTRQERSEQRISCLLPRAPHLYKPTDASMLLSASKALVLCDALVVCHIVYQHSLVPWSTKADGLMTWSTNLMPSYPHSYVQCVW